MEIETSRNDFIDGVALIGFRLNNKIKTPDVFTLITYGVEDIPLSLRGKLVFFTNQKEAGKAFELFTKKIKQNAHVPKEVSLILDVPSMISLIRKGDVDKNAVIINCLNIWFDLLIQMQISLPRNYKKDLYGFADHLTFNSNIEDFLKSGKFSRQRIIDAIYWCLGAIFAHAELLR